MKYRIYAVFAALIVMAAMLTSCKGTGSKADLPEIISGYVDYECSYEDLDALEANGTFLFVGAEGYEQLKAAFDTLNAEVKEDFDITRETVYENLEDFDNEYLSETLPWSHSFTISIQSVGPKMISLTRNLDSFLGGAHPYASSTGVNLDIQTGEKVRLADVVTDYVKVYDIVVETIEKLSEDDDYFFFDEWRDTVNEYFYGEGNQPDWFIDYDGLTIDFDVYQVAPYACGPIDIDIKFKDYPGLVKKEYVPSEPPVQKDVPKIAPLFDEAFMYFSDKVSKAKFEDCKAWFEGKNWKCEIEEPDDAECDGCISVYDEDNNYFLRMFFWPDETGEHVITSLDYRNEDYNLNITDQYRERVYDHRYNIINYNTYTAVDFSCIEDMIKVLAYNYNN